MLAFKFVSILLSYGVLFKFGSFACGRIFFLRQRNLAEANLRSKYTENDGQRTISHQATSTLWRCWHCSERSNICADTIHGAAALWIVDNVSAKCAVSRAYSPSFAVNTAVRCSLEDLRPIQCQDL